MYGRLLRCLLPYPLVLSGCALIGYDLDAVQGGPAGGADAGSALDGRRDGTSFTLDGGDPGLSGRWGWWWSLPDSRRGAGAGTGSDAATPNDAGQSMLGDAGMTVGCLGRPDDAPCEDGLFCTVDDRCSSGRCEPGSDRDCSALDALCQLGACSEQDRACIMKPWFDGDATGCPAGEFCVAGACAAGETCPSEENCDYSCPGTTCNYQCTDANHCRIDCAPASSCVVTACRGSTCEINCAAGSSCLINCFGADDCQHVVCSGDAQCAMNCGAAQNCEFEACGDPAGARSCDGDAWMVCNATCP